MAGEVLVRAGASVTVYDRMASPARKFLMAGRGGLNLTHSEPIDTLLDRYGPDRSLLERAIRAFPPAALRDWADGLGAGTFAGSTGRVFPKAMKASPLLRAWLRRLEGLGVAFRMRAAWLGWTDGALRFGDHVHHSDATILALGGATWPRLGSDGTWRDILAARGVCIEPFAPSNAGVRIAWPEYIGAKFAGTPLKRVALTCGGRTVRGEAMITRNGLEGGALYALSREIRDGLADGPLTITLDLRPDLAKTEVAARLAHARTRDSRSTRLRKALALPPAAIALVTMTGEATAERIKSLPLAVLGQEGLARAISTAGGIALSEIGEDFMLRRMPGTFVAGEMIAWDAPTGGYLLQACMATGAAAARGCLAWLGLPRTGHNPII